MTNTVNLVERPAQSDLLAIDDLYDALVGIRASRRLLRGAGVSVLEGYLHDALTVVLDFRADHADAVVTYLNEHPNANVIDAVDEIFPA